MTRNYLYTFLCWSCTSVIVFTLSCADLFAQNRALRSIATKAATTARARQAQVLPRQTGVVTIENSIVRVGVNKRYGGSVSYIAFVNNQGGRDTSNMINNFDLGRQAQIALYSGPLDYSKGTDSGWSNLGWNPIQAGSVYGDVADVITLEKQDNLLYVKTIPKQFALHNQPGEAYIEHWIHLEGNIIKVHAKATLFRSDKTQYEGRQQEFPCLYTTARYHNIYSYTGTAPYTNDRLTHDKVDSLTHQNLLYGDGALSEPWMATVDNNGYGVGLYASAGLDFKKGYFGADLDGNEYDVTSAYVAATPHVILDHDIEYEWDYAFIVGKLEQIRSYVYTQPRPDKGPNFLFDTSRKGWYYQHTQDTGWRVSGKLHVMLDDAQNARIDSPYAFWKGSENPKIYIRAAFNTLSDKFRFNWRRFDDLYTFPYPDRLVDFPIINDGQFHTYTIDLSTNTNWTSTNIAQIELASVTDRSAPGAWAEFAWVSTSPDGPTPNVVVTNPTNPVDQPTVTQPAVIPCVSNCVPLQIKKVRYTRVTR